MSPGRSPEVSIMMTVLPRLLIGADFFRQVEAIDVGHTGIVQHQGERTPRVMGLAQGL
jgi:hypothetical protein